MRLIVPMNRSTAMRVSVSKPRLIARNKRRSRGLYCRECSIRTDFLLPQSTIRPAAVTRFCCLKAISAGLRIVFAAFSCY